MPQFLAFFARKPALSEVERVGLSMFIRYRQSQISKRTILECLKVSSSSTGMATCIFITASCYRQERLLGTAYRKDLFVKVLEQVHQRYEFVVVGYMAMPEHFPLLISEPERDFSPTMGPRRRAPNL